MENKKMTREQAIELLKNRKVYVNGKSAEIQKKLFELGWKWLGDPYTTVAKYENFPFLYICNSGYLGYSEDMLAFVRDTFTEISAEEILAIEVVEELKENDVVVSGRNGKVEYCKWIAVVKRGDTAHYDYKVALSLGGTGLNHFGLKHDGYANTQEWTVKAKDEEKQILIDALKNSDIEDSKDILKEVFGVEECPFKPFDKVLVRDGYNEEWKPDLFWKKTDDNNYPYLAISNRGFAQCIPYEGHESLIDTTKSSEE